LIGRAGKGFDPKMGRGHLWFIQNEMCRDKGNSGVAGGNLKKDPFCYQVLKCRNEK